MRYSSFPIVRWSVLCAVALLVFPLAAFSQKPNAVPGEILVLFKSQPSADESAREAQRLGLAGQPVRALQAGLIQHEGLRSASRIEHLQAERLQLPQGTTQEQAMAHLLVSPLVQACSLNHYRHAHYTPLSNGPNDPYYQNGLLWWLAAVGADRVVAENVLASGSPITIAIIDTGTDLHHEDLANRLVTGTDAEFPNNPGDEIFLQHGTHTAGLAAASANNGIGIAGTASAAWIKIMPVKVLYMTSDGEAEGNDYDIAQGITWAVDNGARVLNMSLGGPDSDAIEEDAVQYAHDHGCVVVASAGNDAQNYPDTMDTPPSYPAAYDHVIGVGACDINGLRAPYSDHNAYVDIAAPGGYFGGSYQGVSIVSAVPHIYQPPYDYMCGTSMAAPIVSGAAAMVLSQNPTLSPEAVENILETTAEKTGSLAASSKAWDSELGWGRVNVYRALKRATQSTFTAKTSGRPAYNFPNPFNPNQGGITNIVVPLGASDPPSAVRLRIYDAAGYLVKSFDLSAAEVWPGRVVAWDGRNDKGVRVANGVYPFTVELNGKTYTNKIAVNNE